MMLTENQSIKKESVQHILDALPEYFDAEELIEQLILLEKIQQGTKEIDEGDSDSFETVLKKTDEWLK